MDDKEDEEEMEIVEEVAVLQERAGRGNVKEGSGARREKEASNNQEKQEESGKFLLSTIL